MRIPSTIVFLSFLCSIWVGCEKKQAAGSIPKIVSTPLSTPSCDPKHPDSNCRKQSPTVVTKVVFVGKEHACDCTRKRVDTAWAALQKVVGTPAKLPIERLQIDTQSEKVEPYRRQKPMMTLPAIYFLDDKSVVVELVQGEVTTEQISTILNAVN